MSSHLTVRLRSALVGRSLSFKYMSAMENESRKIDEIGGDDFARRFSLRAANLMWFLGAGTSASAGIPTAIDMVWEFKQQLFISQRRVLPQAVADLSSSLIREKIQVHIDSLGNMPMLGSHDEYATLFEAVYPSESDRRTYINAKTAGAKPSYGHLALASFMKAEMARIVWTTNFDPLVADACAKVFDGTGPLTTVALESPDIARACLSEGRWPLEVKLHGDFRSRRLKNTQEELRHQDANMRSLLVDACGRYGLVVCGYSGRDDSIMDTLEEAIEKPDAFPSGLFWLHRGRDFPLLRVQMLIQAATAKGIEAALVRMDNFDEVMRDLVRMIPDLNTSVLNAFGKERVRCTNATTSVGKLGWPVIRLNAINVTTIPTVCRRIVCQIEGFKEVREAIKNANVELLATRVRAGVLLFGSDADSRAAFDSFGITQFDLHPIEQRRLRYDSGERGLLREAVSKAIERNRHLSLVRHRNSDFLYPIDSSDERWKPLGTIVGSLTGTVGKSDLRWHEGIGLRLDWADEKLWILIEPRTVFEGINDDNKATAASFVLERTVKRYNRQLNDLIHFWTNFLAGDGKTISSLGIAEGVDASFALSTTNGFSRRIGV